jgi:hypothetical protein
VKLNWNIARLTGFFLLMAVAMLGSACGGISAGGSASPATFLLPGIGQNAPQQNSPLPAPGKSSSTIAEYSPQLAQ